MAQSNFLPVIIRLLAVFALAHIHAAETGKGYNCLFMGHSFFAPVANSLPVFTAAAGMANHKQTVVFHGGHTGAPGLLWASDNKDVADAKLLLASGKVDLLGLTFYTNAGSDLDDYRKWIDFALEHNATTRFFIMSPWCIKQDKTFAQFEKDTERIHKAVHGLVDDLRKIYPQTTIFCIPQGRWMVELWRLFDEKKLPELPAFVRPEGGTSDALFNDTFGHGGGLAVRTGALLWLVAIYGVDPRELHLDIKSKADLKALAWEIIRADDHARNDVVQTHADRARTSGYPGRNRR